MNDFIRNMLISTALSIVGIACVAFLLGGKFLYVETVFQALLANLIIHMGLWLLSKFESPYSLFEMGLQYGFILLVALVSGMIFDWFASTPPLVLVLLTLAVYALSFGLGMFRTTRDIQYINKEIKKKRKQLT